MTPTPVRSTDKTVRDDWTDYNGHLNMAYFHLIFDNALDEFLPGIGLGPAVAAATNASVFTVEAHIHYLHELRAGDVVAVETQILGHDAKRMHYVQTMRRVADDSIAAITENLILHVDLESRKVVPFRPDAQAALAELARAHAALPVPAQVGRVIGLARPAT